jgi:hypothetical protein
MKKEGTNMASESAEVEEEEFDLDSIWDDEEDGVTDEEPKDDKAEETDESEDEESESEDESEEEEESESESEDDPKEEEPEKKEEPNEVKLARERVQTKLDAEDAQRRAMEIALEKSNFSEEDLSRSLKFDIPDIKVKIDDEDVSLKEVAKDNPEVVALMKVMLGMRTKELTLDVVDVSNKLAMREYWESVEDAHPGARKLKNDDKFTDWLVAQDDDIKMLAGSSDPDDVIVMLDAYKATLPKEEQKKEESKTLKKKKSLMKKSSAKKGAAPKPAENEDAELKRVMEKLWGVDDD